MELLDLPDDTLLRIMQYLPLADLVCDFRLVSTRCMTLSYDFSLWRDIDLRPKADFVTDAYILRLLEEAYEHVESLDLTGCQLLTDASLLHEGTICPRLKKINISKTKVTDDGLEKLVKKYPALEAVYCSRCRNLSRVFETLSRLSSLKTFFHPYDDCYEYCEDTIMMASTMLKNNPRLQHIRLCDNHIGNDVIMTVSEYCKDVETLEIPSCSQFSGDTLSQCVANWPALSSLDISGTTLTDNHLRTIIDTCPKIKELNVSECRRITDVSVIYLAQSRGASMEVLRLNDSSSYSGNVTDVALQEIGQRCNMLTEVYISFCPSVTDSGVQALLKGCPKMMVLDISGCLSLTDSALSGLTVACPDIRRFNASGCVQLTSRSINNILQYGRKLRCLELMTCHYLCKLRFMFQEPSEAASIISTVAASGEDCIEKTTNDDNSKEGISLKGVNARLYTVLCSQLHSVDFSFCSKIDNNSLIQLSTFCKQLQYISVQGCYQLTDMAMEEVTKKCQKLAAFNISGGSVLETLKLTDDTLASVAANCQELRTLSMTSNRLMTTSGLKKLIEGCWSLRSVYFTSGKGVSLHEVVQHTERVRAKCSIKNFNLDYVTTETKGNFMLKFPPFGRYN